MMRKPRPAIALLVEASRSYGRDLLRGAALYARTQSDWSLLHQEMTLDTGAPDWLASAGVSGVIARVDTHTIDSLRKLNVPIVDVCCNHKFSGVPQVETDNEVVAQLAFRHLWDRGFRRFAFCGFKFASYSDARLKCFRQLVTDAGCFLSVHESQGKPNRPLTSIERAGIDDVGEMFEWLQTLQRPTGLFVCNDIRGQQVLNACRTAQIAVPDDLGVIGVDDDDAICMLCDPPLSSVRPDAERVGYRAAELLHEMLAGELPHREIEYIAPRSVHERMSTNVVAVEDRELARVCRFIRQHACDGINVATITQFTSLSRRQLERRFRGQLGRTPHQEITAVQLDRVKQLLTETDLTLEEISLKTGYAHKESLSSVFKREISMTPGEFRRQAQRNPPSR
ncbi:AraC family transcriptional regulator [Allorhodopirellula heiligendammensis]|uniref:Xylose operon regulatory protein n=1 Tax=Allorhodopirellula heiligendammensis TaxID=2714739 RepID=A0A5C6C8V5_9BACT|nr:DNA-binding transcriptional regulator [Allorhodopirellula heiligendammensis]TWU19784.1 Xylose operon regulatory protein [Allorhodopirellula heiligendammensis]